MTVKNAFSISRQTALMFALSLLMAAVTLGGCLILMSPAQSVFLIKFLGYWLMSATFGLFVVVCWKDLKEISGVFVCHVRAHRAAIAFVLLLSGFLHLHEAHMMRILADEAVISGSAKSMHEDRYVAVPIQAHHLNGHLELMTDMPDKRPYLVPYLISTLHDLTGFRFENAFILNALAGTGLLLALYFWGFQIGGVRVGVTLALLMAGLPLLAQLVTSAGLEPVNAFLLVAFALSGWRYFRRSGTDGLNLFIFLGIILSQARYESILYTASIPILFILKGLREKSVGLTWFSVFSPLLLAPPLLVQKIFQSDRSFLQLDSADDVAFGLTYLSDNISHALFYLFNFSTFNTNAPLISALCVLVFLFVCLRLPKWIGQNHTVWVWVAIGVPTLFNFGLLMLYYWGNLDDLMVSRLCLPLLIFGLMGVPIVLQEHFSGKRMPLAVPVLAALHLLTFTLASNTQAQATSRLKPAMALEFGYEQLDKLPEGSRPFIYTRTSTAFIIKGYGSSYPEALFNKLESIPWMLEIGLYDDVYLLQQYIVDQAAGNEVEYMSPPLDLFFEKEVQAEMWIDAKWLVRFSKVTGIRDVTDEEMHDWIQKNNLDAAQFEEMVEPTYDWPEDGYENESDYFEDWYTRLP